MPVDDQLFQLPLAEFTAARNALAADLAARGRADDAARVKALGKPPVSAWAVNQLYWRHRRDFDALLAAGAQLNQTQASHLRGRGGNVREPLEARRRAVATLLQHAGPLLREAGHPISPDLMRRITTTLEALATYAGGPSAPEAGRLTADVDAPGFEAVAALVGARTTRKPAGAPSRVLPFVAGRTRKTAGDKPDPAEKRRREEEERRRQQAAAAEALKAAERELAAARQTAARAEAALKKAAAQAKTTRKAQEALTARYEKATALADAAHKEARRVAAEAEEAAQAVTDAERAVEEARAAVRKYSKS